MSTTVSFTPSMISAALKDLTITFQRINDEDVFRFGMSDEKSKSEMVFGLTCQGSNKEVVVMYAFREKQNITREHWSTAMVAVNTWNQEKLSPKVYFKRDDDGETQVKMESSYDFEKGVTQEQLSFWITRFIATSCSFNRWLQDEHGL